MEAQELTLHKNILRIILGGIIALSAAMFSKCSRRTAAAVVVGGGWCLLRGKQLNTSIALVA